jgi:O-antigen ligase/tetratricopeptide (TPR) repeat protein
MTDRLLRIIDNSALALLGLTITAAFLFPVFTGSDLGILYKTMIAATGFLYIIRVKLLKTEDKLETPIDGPMFMLFLWFIISTVNAADRFTAFNAAVTFFTLLLFYYIVYSYAKKYSRHFTFFLIGVACLLSLYGLYQYLFGFDQTLKYLAQNPVDHLQDVKARLESGRIFSTLIYPNTFAGFLALVIPVAAGLFKNEKKLRPALGAALILLLLNLILTRSIGAFISLIAATVLVFFSIKDASLKTFKSFLLMLLAAIVIFFLVVLKLRGVAQILPDMSRRMESWLKMLEIARHYFLTGSGPGSFDAVYNGGGFAASPYLKYAHNVILQPLVELGLPGLALLLIAAFYGYRSILQNFYHTRTPQRKVLIVSFLTGITAFLLHNMVDFDIYSFELSLAFLFALAVLMSQVTIGTIELKKIKLTYMLGINPGKRRSLIFAVILTVLALSAVTCGRQVLVLAAINSILAAGIALWSVSKEDFRGTNLDYPVLALFLLSSISLMYTPDLYTGIKYLTLMAGAAAVFYLFSQFLRRYTYKIITGNFIMWTGIALCFAGLGQFAYRYFTKFEGGAFIDCFFPNSNIFASYLVVPFGFLLGKLLFEKKINYLWPKAALVVLFIITESLAESKGGMLQMLLVFCLMWAYYTYNRKHVKDIEARAVFKSRFLKTLFALLLLAAFLPITPSGNKIISVKADPFYFNRLGIYKATARMIADRPVLGWGLGSYGRVFQSYNFPIDAPARYQKETPFAHNEFLQFGQALGIPGLLILLWLIFSILRNLPEREGHRKLWTATAGAYFGMIGVLFSCLFHFNLHVPGMIMTCAVMAAMISREKFAIRTIPKEALFFTKIYYFPELIFAFILFSLAIKPALAWYLEKQYDSTKQYNYLADAAAVEPLNPDHFYKIGLLLKDNKLYADASARFEDALRHDPKNFMALLNEARAQNSAGSPKTALSLYNRAIAASPYNAFMYAELAYFYRTGFSDSAMQERCLQKALSLEPNFLAARQSLALRYREQGKKQEALSQFNEIESLMSSVSPVTEYEKALLGLPPGALYFNKAGLLKDMENYPESCYYYKKSFGITKDPDIGRIMRSVCGKGAGK